MIYFHYLGRILSFFVRYCMLLWRYVLSSTFRLWPSWPPGYPEIPTRSAAQKLLLLLIHRAGFCLHYKWTLYILKGQNHEIFCTLFFSINQFLLALLEVYVPRPFWVFYIFHMGSGSFPAFWKPGSHDDSPMLGKPKKFSNCASIWLPVSKLGNHILGNYFENLGVILKVL